MTRRYGQKEKKKEKRENATETQTANDTEIRRIVRIDKLIFRSLPQASVQAAEGTHSLH